MVDQKGRHLGEDSRHHSGQVEKFKNGEHIFSFFRMYAASSSDGQGGWLVTGGDGVVTEVFLGGQWSQGPDLPYPVNHHCQVLVDGTVYITGGFGGGNRTLMLGPDGWEEVAGMSQARAFHACVEHQGKLWVIGGEEGDPFLDSVEIFDPATGMWQPGPSLPVTITAVRGFS